MSKLHLKEALAQGTARLRRAGVTSARLDSLVLLEHVTGRDRAWLLAHPEDGVTQKTRRQFQKLLARRLEREPTAYLTGHAHFYGLELVVSPQVLIPRPETEALVTYAIKKAGPGTRVLDVGTGSGAIALALRSQRADLKLTACDISRPALAIAKLNRARYSMHDIDFRVSNIMHDLKGRFDVIVANLPYVPGSRKLALELSYEPKEALLGGRDGLGLYRQLFAQTPPRLEREGKLVLEAEPGQAGQLDKLAKGHYLRALKHQGFLHVYSRD